MTYKAINLAKNFSLFTEQWQPKVIAEMFVVPKGVEHKSHAEREVKLMIIETRSAKNTGEDRTAPNDVWI